MCPADLSCPADPDRPRAASSRSNAEPDVQYGRPKCVQTLKNQSTGVNYSVFAPQQLWMVKVQTL